MKNIKQKFEVIIRLTLAVITFVTSFGYTTSVFAQTTTTRGKIKDAEQSIGSATIAGDVELTKTVSAADKEGVFNVTLTATGIEKESTQSTFGNIYTVVVFDTSGSMRNYCDGYEGTLTGECYGTIVKKYNDAVDGAQTFASELLKQFDNVELALVTFESEVEVKREFKKADFSGVTFPGPDGYTNLGAAIQKANDILVDKKNADEDAILYMVILSDGYPEYQTVDHTTAANTAKANDIEIFTIGYDVDSDTKELLQGVATSTSHFVEADTSSIVEDFSNLVDEINVPVPAGTNATITDVIADGFTYVDGSANPNTATVEGQTISFDIGTLTSAGTTVSFQIKIDKNLETDWYRTNTSATLSYNDPTKDETAPKEEKTITDSSEIYWIQEEYDYTVNYYQDSLEGTKLGSVSSSGVIDEEITTSDIEINKFKPETGYQNGVIVTNMPYTIVDGENIINVVYSKKSDLSYTVEYYKDNNKISDDAKNTVTNQTFGTQIQANQIELNKYKPLVGYNPGVFETDMPYTIQDGTNTIKVCYYKRTDMSYTVKYLEKDTNASIGLADEVRNGKTFEGTYEETAKAAPTGYRLVGENTQEVYIDQDNKIVTFYYEKRNDFSYKVNYLEKNTNKVLYKQTIRNNKTYNKTYTEYAIEISGYNLVGENTQTFSLTEDGFEITFLYTKKTNLSYTINYYKDTISDSNKFKTETEENQVFNTTITSDMIDVLENTPFGYTNGTITNKMPYTIIDGDNIINVVYNKRTDMNYIVKFIDNTALEELNSKVKENKTYLEIYTETVEDSDIPFGYELVGDKTQEVLMDEDGKVVTFKFEKRKDFKYVVNYLEKDTNNVLAPSKEETDKTYLETYEETALIIPGYNLVGEETQEVYIDAENIEITFFYTKKTDLTYRVEYYLDGEIDSSKTDIFEGLEFGTVIRGYKDKLPDGYVFDKDTAPLTIEDSEDNVLKVYYKSLPHGDMAPPKTGIDNTNYLPLIYLIATIGLVFISRKQEN